MKVVDRFGKWCFVVSTAALVAVTACVELDDSVDENAGSLVSNPAYPLRLGSAGSRYLIDQNGVPFLWSGDTAWSLIAQLSLADADRYLDDRKAKGFNVVLVNLLEHRFATRAPANIAGDLPFGERPFAMPNEPYFAHADAVIRAAGARGITVLLAPLYLGWGCGSEGWCSEVAHASEAEMYAWGRYIGSRYRDFDNLVWLIGGDADPSPVRAKVLAMVRGIRETDYRHLFTAHNDVTTARTRWPNQDWISIDNVYSYNAALHENDRAVYAASPTLPYFLLESNYEHEHGVTSQHLRAQAYWTMLSGGMGHIFGNCPIWHFGATPSWCGTADWQSNLNDIGSISMMYLHRLFGARPWHTLVPDWNATVLTNGRSSGADLAIAARASDGGTVLAYLPTPRPVTIDMSQISGTNATVWWFSPTTGTATKLGTYFTSGSRTFSPPNGDSVLVIDDASRNYPSPGTSDASPPPVQQPPVQQPPVQQPPVQQPPVQQPPSSSPPPNDVPSLRATDIVVDFEGLANNVALSNQGGISWPVQGMRWRVWDGYAKYTKNAFIDSIARTEVTATFQLPNNAVLKSLRMAAGSGAHATSVKISSPGNVERVYTDIAGSYSTKTLNWSTPSSTITVKVTCNTIYGASDIAFDTITYTVNPTRPLQISFSQ